MDNTTNTKTNEEVICPHCGSSVDEIISKSVSVKEPPMSGWVLYACPNCKKVLSVGGKLG